MSSTTESNRSPRGPHLGISTRIAGGSFVIAVLCCLVAGVLLDLRIGQLLRSGSEAILASDAAPYVQGVREGPDEEADPPGPSQQIAVISPDGTALVDTLPTALSAEILRSPAPASLEVDVRGSPAELVRVEPVPTEKGVWQVVSARPAAHEQAVLDQMRILIGGALTVVALGVLVTALALTSASLRPVRRIRWTADQLIDAPGDALLPVGPAEDEIARLARTLNTLIDKLRSTARRERQLVSDASHELRTPLAILRTQLELARHGDPDVERLLTDLDGAERSTLRLAALVDSLLELSTIESSAPTGASAEDLDAEAREAVDRAAFRLEGRGIELREDLDLAGPADPTALDAPAASGAPDDARFAVTPADFGRALDNLLSNAVRAIGDHGRITVGLHRTPLGLALTVADTGGGMPAEFVDRALDRFSQGDAARSGTNGRSDTAGAGLGLAIVAAIVERAEGTITLDNHPGEGLTVRIALPGTAPEDPLGPAARPR